MHLSEFWKRYQNKLFKLIMVIFSLMGCLFQVSTLLRQYMERKTLVNIRFGMIDIQPHSALTLCAQLHEKVYAFSPMKIAAMNTEFAKLSEDWRQKTYDEFDKLLFTKNYQVNTTILVDIKKQVENMFIKIVKDMSREFGTEITVDDYMSNLSLSSSDLGVLTWFDGKIVKIVSSTYVKQKSPKNEFIGQPIDSMSGYGKCFSYYTLFDVNANGLEISESKQIEFKFQPNSFTNYLLQILLPFFRFKFAIHSPNVLPSTSGTEFVELRQSNLFHISQIVIDRYSSGYDTDCTQYQPNGPNDTKSRTDCILQCFYGTRSPNITQGNLIYMNKLITKPIYSMYSWKKLTGYEFGDLMYRCEKNCKVECHIRYYNIDEQSRDGDYKNSFDNGDFSFNGFQKQNQKSIIVRIYHSSKLDMEVNHYPEMTFVSLVCNFGGLLGMWTGISIMLLLENFPRFSKYLVNNYVFKQKLENSQNILCDQRVVHVNQHGNHINSQNTLKRHRV